MTDDCQALLIIMAEMWSQHTKLDTKSRPLRTALVLTTLNGDAVFHVEMTAKETSHDHFVSKQLAAESSCWLLSACPDGATLTHWLEMTAEAFRKLDKGDLTAADEICSHPSWTESAVDLKVPPA